MKPNCLTNSDTCHTVWETYPEKANCDWCTTTNHSSDPALREPVDGLRRIIPEERTSFIPFPCVISDPTVFCARGRFLFQAVRS